MSRRDVWITVNDRFDPYESLTPEHAAWRADRERSPANEIISYLSKPFAADARILVTGTVGTGKTTELLRLVEARSPHELVVFLDLASHFDKVVGNPEGLQRISPWEVCFMAGLTLYREAERRIGFEFPPELLRGLEAAWKEIAATSETPPPGLLDIGKLAQTLATGGATLIGGPIAGAAARFAGGAASALSWNLPMGQAKKALPDDNEAVKTMLNRVNRIIGEVQSRHRAVLLVIDGLDRIRDVGRARELFVDSDLLARLACRVVACGPFALRHHPAAAIVPRFQLRPLVNEPVLDQNDPSQPGPGLWFFGDLFRRRVQDLPGGALIPEELLEKLAYYSGGRARDFVKMIRLVAQGAWTEDVDVATPEIVDAVIDQERRLLETGLHRGHIEVLEKVMIDPDHRLPNDDLVWELLTLSRLLPYPDHSEWYYPHPLLTRHLLRPGRNP